MYQKLLQGKNTQFSQTMVVMRILMFSVTLPLANEQRDKPLDIRTSRSRPRPSTAQDPTFAFDPYSPLSTSFRQTVHLKDSSREIMSVDVQRTTVPNSRLTMEQFQYSHCMDDDGHLPQRRSGAPTFRFSRALEKTDHISIHGHEDCTVQPYKQAELHCTSMRDREISTNTGTTR